MNISDLRGNVFPRSQITPSEICTMHEWDLVRANNAIFLIPVRLFFCLEMLHLAEIEEREHV